MEWIYWNNATSAKPSENIVELLEYLHENDIKTGVVSNIMLPLGSLIFVLFCTWRSGWGWKSFVAEANEGKGMKVAGWMRGYMTFVLPVIVAVILVLGLL